MKILMCIALGIVVSVMLLVTIVWVGTFFENISIDITKPLDVIADHAENTAKVVEAMRKAKEE